MTRNQHSDQAGDRDPEIENDIMSTEPSAGDQFTDAQRITATDDDDAESLQDDDWPELAAELRTVFDLVDPVPPEVEAVAYGALAWRELEADLAELVADTADAETQLADVRRSGDLPRLVTFEAPGVVVEVEVADTGRTRSLLGQLVPVGPATVEVQTPDDATSVEADELGRFALEDVSAGPVRLNFTLSEGERRIVTSWTTV